MKQLWIRLDEKSTFDQKANLLKMAQGTCDVAVLSPDDLSLASGLKLRTASTQGHSDIRLVSCSETIGLDSAGECAVEVVVKDGSDELKVLRLADQGVRYLLVQCPNWKIIPLENLIARTRGRAMLIADVQTIDEAKIALETLELGADGVIITAKSAEDIEEMGRFLKRHEALPLVRAKVSSVKAIGTGARVCVDTTELMEPGEGILVGSQSAGLFLVEAEVYSNPHVDPRPFRVNAGPVSSYVLTPESRTRYLSELKAGEEVLIVARSGAARKGHVGRVKIERRPMTVVEAKVGDRSYSIILQNAETVRLVSDHTSKPVSTLQPGDEVLIRVEEGGRHFGTLVRDEMVIER